MIRSGLFQFSPKTNKQFSEWSRCEFSPFALACEVVKGSVKSYS